MVIVNAKREAIKREDFRAGIVSMLIRSACGQKNVHPFDFFPQHKDTSSTTRRGITDAAQVRANFRAYIEATKQHGQKNKESS